MAFGEDTLDPVAARVWTEQDYHLDRHYALNSSNSKEKNAAEVVLDFYFSFTKFLKNFYFFVRAGKGNLGVAGG